MHKQKSADVWKGAKENLESVEYRCFFCDKDTASNVGWRGTLTKWDIAPDGKEYPTIDEVAKIRICPICKSPTFFSFVIEETLRQDEGDHIQIPEPLPLSKTESGKREIDNLFEEIRRCFHAKAYTAVAMLCRKILMNIAVEKGAMEGDNFENYITYLSDENWVPPNGKPLLKEIKKYGNNANHKIEEIEAEQAEKTLKFTRLLVTQAYGFDINKRK